MDSMYSITVGGYLAIDKAISRSSWIHPRRLDRSRVVRTTEVPPKSADQVTGKKEGVDNILTFRSL